MTDEGRCVLRELIRDVPDFPKPGIIFKDISPLLAHSDCFRVAIDRLADHWSGRGVEMVAGIDARGFLFAAPVAYRLGVGFVAVRKAGKLPLRTVSESVELEYGADELEIHADAIHPQTPTLLIDDVLATGGSAAAAKSLIEAVGAEVIGFGFLCELDFLNGRDKLGDTPVHSLVNYQ